MGFTTWTDRETGARVGYNWVGKTLIVLVVAGIIYVAFHGLH